MNKFPSHKAYSGLHIFNETDCSLPFTESELSQILPLIERNEACHFSLIEVVFVDEENILQINNEHLNHDYVTDIITFHYSDEADFKNIEGTLYCCYPRIEQQAEEQNESIKKEFLRIVIHGLLHLCGYDDETDTEKDTMTRKESFYLSKLSLH